MEEQSNLQDWEILSDSDTNSIFALEDIIHSDYFTLDSTNLLKNDQEDVFSEETEFSEKNLFASDPETEKGGSFIAENGKSLLGFEENESKIVKEGSFLENELEFDAEMGEIEKGDTFIAENSKHDDEIAKREVFYEENSNLVVGIDSKHEFSTQKIEKDVTFIANDSNTGGGIDESEKTNESSEESSAETSEETGDSNRSVAVSDAEKVMIWWKFPLDILKMCACRIRPVWSISIAAAFIGILMVGRRLYKMKNRTRRVPLKISYEDKKAASKLLLQAARLNEVIVRRVPVVRSPMLPAGGVTPWPVIGLY